MTETRTGTEKLCPCGHRIMVYPADRDHLLTIVGTSCKVGQVDDKGEAVCRCCEAVGSGDFVHPHVFTSSSD